MSDNEFTAGRSSFLTKIIEKQKIFQTDVFHDLFEETARENIRNEIEQLTQK
jgi:predicted metal-dependent HD superfamily phosphohydrolase